MKTKLLKRLRHAVNEKYEFEETFERDNNGKITPLYRVCDLDWNDTCYRIVKAGYDRQEIWGKYMEIYRKYIFDELDGLYARYNKNPKSVRHGATEKQLAHTGISLESPITYEIKAQNQANTKTTKSLAGQLASIFSNDLQNDGINKHEDKKKCENNKIKI